MLVALDHVNIRTAHLDAMVEWYRRVLGMPSGPRPPFDFPGAWLYLGDQALVHLVGVAAQPQGLEPQLEHFAISAEGMADFLAHLKAEGVAARVAEVPGFGVIQVNIHDPDGNHIHIDFAAAEAP